MQKDVSMPKIDWRGGLAWLLAAFFLVGSYGNTFVSARIAADYARWGYPENFHYLTAVLEFITAGLLMSRSRRFYGSLLGSAVMLAAAGTVVQHGEYTHAIPPLLVLAVCVLVGVLTLRSRQRL
jgi:hypothetical protein